jgi:hypothetical protein
VSISSRPLEQLAEVLGVERAVLEARDRPGVLLLEAEVSAERAAHLTDEIVTCFAEEYGPAATLRILYNGLEEFTLEHGAVDTASLAALRERIDGRSDMLTVNLRIDKIALLPAIVAPGAAQTQLFFFRSAVERALCQPPRSIQEDLWADPDHRLVVAVLDAELDIERGALSILSVDRLSDVGGLASRPAPDGLARMAARRDDYISWDTGLRTRLTPTHLAPVSLSGDVGDLPHLLDGLVISVAAMFLCDRAREQEHEDGAAPTARVEFKGRDHTAVVPVPWGRFSAEEYSAANASAAVKLTEWCYQTTPDRPADDFLADRLPFVQTRVAQLLEGRPEQDRLVVLASAMPALVDSCRWNWQSFIEGRVGVYLDQVAGLEAAVGDAVGALTERTSALTGKVTETALAEVATLVGAFIAAAFQQPFQSRLFTAAMVAYAAYVLVFPFGIGLSSAVGSCRQATKSFGPQQRNVAEVLGADRVNHLIDKRVENAAKRFRFWARLAAVAYVIAAAVSVAAGLVVPGIVRN